MRRSLVRLGSLRLELIKVGLHWARYRARVGLGFRNLVRCRLPVKRHGTTDLFAALDVKAGAVIGACKGRHRAVEFRAFLGQVEAAVPADLDVHLVLDNAATHKAKLVQDWLLQRPRWHLHFTPTSASWLNLVEAWFALLTRRRLQRGVFTSTADLEAAIQDHIDQTNAEPKPFVWTKSADAILASIKHFCQRTSNSDH